MVDFCPKRGFFGQISGGFFLPPNIANFWGKKKHSYLRKPEYMGQKATYAKHSTSNREYFTTEQFEYTNSTKF